MLSTEHSAARPVPSSPHNATIAQCKRQSQEGHTTEYIILEVKTHCIFFSGLNFSVKAMQLSRELY